MVASAFNASTAAGYDGFLSTFITRGMALPDASMALHRKRFGSGQDRSVPIANFGSAGTSVALEGLLHLRKP